MEGELGSTTTSQKQGQTLNFQFLVQDGSRYKQNETSLKRCETVAE
jgi:hypothetical protein